MKTPVLKCNCGDIFSIDSDDSIHQKNLKENKFRKIHSGCIQKKFDKIRKIPEFNIKRRSNKPQ